MNTLNHMVLKGEQFTDIPGIQSNVASFLHAISKDDFVRSFLKLYSHHQKCIANDPHYFERI